MLQSWNSSRTNNNHFKGFFYWGTLYYDYLWLFLRPQEKEREKNPGYFPSAHAQPHFSQGRRRRRSRRNKLIFSVFPEKSAKIVPFSLSKKCIISSAVVSGRNCLTPQGATWAINRAALLCSFQHSFLSLWLNKAFFPSQPISPVCI